MKNKSSYHFALAVLVALLGAALIGYILEGWWFALALDVPVLAATVLLRPLFISREGRMLRVRKSSVALASAIALAAWAPSQLFVEPLIAFLNLLLPEPIAQPDLTPRLFFVVIGALLTLVALNLIWTLGERGLKRREQPVPPSEKDIVRVLLVLREKVRHNQIKNTRRLLHHQILIDLNLVSSPGDVKYRGALVRESPEAEPLPEATITEVFDQSGMSLLILGAPGSGKTMMLLELARALIERAEEDETRPTPVVLNLASWSKKKYTLAAWLVEEMRLEYNVPPRMGQVLLERHCLTLLLDGLDEVEAGSRARCIEAINVFQSKYGLNGLVVCSRAAEYRDLPNVALASAVHLQPLTGAQIETYLKDLGSSYRALAAAISSDRGMEELAQFPLMLFMMARVYEGSAAVPESSGDAEAQRNALFIQYVEKAFERRGGRYRKARMLRRLQWVARQMEDHTKSQFRIEELQQTWLVAAKRKRFRLVYGLCVKLFGGLVFGLAAGLGAGLSYGLGAGLGVGLFGGLVFGLVAGLGFGSDADAEITTTEKISWNLRSTTFRDALVESLFEGLIIGLGVGLVAGVGVVLGGGLVAGLTAGFFGGMVVILVVGLGFGLIDGMTVQTVKVKSTPNQGIHETMKSGLLVGLVIGLGVGLGVGLVFGLGVGLIAGLGTGLGAGLGYGSAPFAHALKHYILRIFLAADGALPIRCVPFLDYACDILLLQRIGGGYSFIHPLLREHFATMEETS